MASTITTAILKANVLNWARAHHDWKFWVALSLMLAAMVIYVMSDDLTFRPHRQVQQSQSGAIGK
jgi:formate hydrogenlyase subunit 3/multisubunit Na+/H+ antiporter MnhD subunit